MNICVYCSANNNIAQHYKDMAHALGQWIAQNGHTLVFGGATGGLMTEVSQGAASVGGCITGIVPKRIIAAGRECTWVTEQHIVADMNERKALMKKIADAFIVLPGSYGTLDELFDVVASGTVGEHKKPLYIINYQGFYNNLLAQINTMKTEYFIPQEEHYRPLVCKDVESCLAHLQSDFINS